MNKSDIETQIKILFDCWVEKNQQEQSSQKIRYAGPALGKEEYSNMLDAIFNDWWSGGKFTYNAERKLAEISSRNYGILTNSGSSANLVLMAAARELYFNKGDKILTLSCGFPTTVNPIIQAGLIPVFVDIDLETLNLNPLLLEEALSKDKNIKGVFVAHTLGFKGDVDFLLDIARKYNVLVFFDCCDAYGSTYKSYPLSSYGKAATYSFYAAHHLTMGEGGAVTTNDDKLQITMKGFRNWGRYCSSPNCCVRSVNKDHFCPNTKLSNNTELPEDYIVNYQYEWMGYNLKPLEIQSAILMAQIEKMNSFNEIRKNNYNMLYNYIQTQKFNLKTWKLDEETSPFSFPILLPKDIKFKRKHLADFLQQHKIESRVLFGGNLMKHPAYSKNKDLWESYGSHDNSNNILENFIMLGVSQINSDVETQKIINVLNDFFKRW
jgi:CDP-6-deoxy-D-xylo-4-hexulose-3-dehydrase